jgi:Ser/Thr protein kinase RdoA (MazF antagonist)
MARFHAIQPSAEFRVWLDQSPCRVFVRLAQAGCAIERVYGHARDGELGRPLQEFCSSSVRSLRQLQSAARQVAERTEAMPRGLVHTDFSRENMGRHRPGELLVLDVEFVSIGPRFFDVAGMIGWPPQKWSPDLRNIELGRHYLDEYSRGGGTPPSLEVFFDEARLLWLAERLRYVGFILDMALRCSQESPAEDERRRASCDELYRTLTTLLAQYRLRGTNWSVLDRQ